MKFHIQFSLWLLLFVKVAYVFVSYLYTYYILCFLSGPVSWIHWWLNFMSSWVILQTTKALILKTFPMVRISDGKSTPKEPIPRLWIALELGLTPLKESTLIVDSFAVLLAFECTILASSEWNEARNSDTDVLRCCRNNCHILSSCM